MRAPNWAHRSTLKSLLSPCKQVPPPGRALSCPKSSELGQQFLTGARTSHTASRYQRHLRKRKLRGSETCPGHTGAGRAGEDLKARARGPQFAESVLTGPGTQAAAYSLQRMQPWDTTQRGLQGITLNGDPLPRSSFSPMEYPVLAT